jgi:hypothetical protein
MRNRSRNPIFWISYSDLMTGLFFVGLVLFVITLTQNQKLEIVNRHLEDSIKGLDSVQIKNKELIDEVKNIDLSLSGFDSAYYYFDEENIRLRLKVDIEFMSNKYDINELGEHTKKDLYLAGMELYKMIEKLNNNFPDVEYLLVVEGSAQRSNDNQITNPDGGYRLSYNRALALVNFWDDSGFDFSSRNTRIAANCEIIIAGSGYFGKLREQDEKLNKRFTIQITPKIGKFLRTQFKK